jgi:hypothetical protein
MPVLACHHDSRIQPEPHYSACIGQDIYKEIATRNRYPIILLHGFNFKAKGKKKKKKKEKYYRFTFQGSVAVAPI